MSGVYVHRRQVRFGDCDPAGVVYYPRFLHFFHEAMETWFGEALGAAYHEVVMGRRIGFPAVHCEADFKRPCAFGEVLAVELRVAEIGRSSLRFAYRVRAFDDPEGPARLTGGTVCAAMDLDPESPGFRRAVAIPADLRAAIERFAAAGGGAV